MLTLYFPETVFFVNLLNINSNNCRILCYNWHCLLYSLSFFLFFLTFSGNYPLPYKVWKANLMKRCVIIIDCRIIFGWNSVIAACCGRCLACKANERLSLILILVPLMSSALQQCILLNWNVIRDTTTFFISCKSNEVTEETLHG